MSFIAVPSVKKPPEIQREHSIYDRVASLNDSVATITPDESSTPLDAPGSPDPLITTCENCVAPPPLPLPPGCPDPSEKPPDPMNVSCNTPTENIGQNLLIINRDDQFTQMPDPSFNHPAIM
jgi:hypothetical protein